MRLSPTQPPTLTMTTNAVTLDMVPLTVFAAHAMVPLTVFAAHAMVT
jgi:hypothetical protein